jgi:predicted enzyme related to lactoylglutathione lyase
VPAPRVTYLSPASDSQALFELAKGVGVRIIREPFDGPFGGTFVLSDPDGYMITIYERINPRFWPPRS